MEKNSEIIPGYGLGNLKFGMTKEEVVKIAGEPDRETVDKDEFGNTLTCHFSGKRFSLYFEEEDDFLLSCIETDHPDTVFFDEKIIGFSKEKFLKLVEKNDLGEIEETIIEVEGVKEEDFEKCLTIDSLELNFYFYDDKLISVQAGVLFNDDDEVCWPV